MSQKYKHSFCKSWLRNYNHKIFIGAKRILECDDDVFANFSEYFVPLETQMKVGSDFVDLEGGAEPKPISYDELRNLGFSITTTKSPPTMSVQKLMVLIRGKDKGNVSDRLLRDNTIEFDPINQCIRLRGPNSGPLGISGWAFRVLKGVKKKKYDAVEIMQRMHKKWRGIKLQENIETVDINEVPLMITDDNKLLCIPTDGDPPTIGIVGKRGGGKSFIMNALLGSIKWKKVFDNFVFLNDSLDQFYDLNQPNDGIRFGRDLLKINHTPRPLPTVNLYLSSPDLEMRYADEGIDFRYVVDFYDFLGRYKFWSYGIQKWDIGSPEKYLSRADTKQALYRCADAEKIKQALYKSIAGSKGEIDQGVKSMIFRWESAFESVFQEQFTNNLFANDKEVAAQWFVEYGDGTKVKENPIIVLMEAGLVPVINTSRARYLNYFRNCMADILDRLVKWQLQTDKKRRLWIFIDELRDIVTAKQQMSSGSGVLLSIGNKTINDKTAYVQDRAKARQAQTDFENSMKTVFGTQASYPME